MSSCSTARSAACARKNPRRERSCFAFPRKSTVLRWLPRKLQARASISGQPRSSRKRPSAERNCLPGWRQCVGSHRYPKEALMAAIGFIGASGLMGHGMAKNLLARGHALALTVHRNRDRVADLLAAGAVERDTPAELARTSEIVFLCVTGSPQVEASLAGPSGLLAGAKRGLVIVDCSTSEPDSTARLREAGASAGVSLVDAPLARTPIEAEAGKLNVMVGADDATFARLEPVLRGFAENVFHVGGPGAGHIVKLLNNFIAQAICTATAEAFAVGQRAGVDPQKLVDIVSLGAVNSGPFQMMAKTLTGDLGALKF